MPDIRLSLQNLADAISPETGTQDGFIDTVDTSIKRIADALPGKLDETDPEAIASAVSDWLENHPEAIVVNDGTITRAKLDSSVGQAVDEVTTLKADLSQIFFEEAITPTWSQGYINSSTGYNGNDPASCYANIYTVGDFIIVAGTGYKTKVALYATGNVFQGIIVPLTAGSVSVSVQDGYRISVQVTKDSDTLNPSDVDDGVLSITKKVYTDTSLSRAGKIADAKATGDTVGNLYAVTKTKANFTSEVVTYDMSLAAFKTAFDAKRQEYADGCLASIKGFVQMLGASSWEEVYKRANQFFRKDIYIDGISHALFCDRVNAAFETPTRRFMDAKISGTICDFSLLVHEGQGGEPSLVVSPDGGTLWAYSYGTRWESTDGVTWGNPTLIVRSDADTSAAPFHMGICVAGNMIFMFGRDQTSPYNLKMYTSPVSDGINFTYRGIPFAIGHDFGDGLHIDSWGNSAITKIGDTYYLFIEGRQSVDGNFWDIYVATATDPFVDNGDGTVGNWTNGAVAPILNGQAIWGGSTAIACGNPDIARGADNMPIRVDGKFFMYYHMTASSYSYIRRAYSYDLIHWVDEQAIFDNRKIPTVGENQSSNADHSLIEFKGKTYMVYTHDINTTRTPHLYEMVDDRTFREMLSIRP